MSEAAHLVEYTREEPSAWLMPNRPDELNAFSDEPVTALMERCRQCDADGDAHIAILHGNGRAFSA
ncbi:MAG: hypothetical protein GKR94_06495 [Gammaproteobacteria bacterium]|nr:hypothetical protein [Gammaproteobacteria bacterium]